MSPQKPVVVVNVSLAGAERDYEEHVTFLDREFHLLRRGTYGNVGEARELVRKWADEADAIAVTGLREARAAGLYDGDLAAVERVKSATRLVPVTDGQALADVLQEWAVRQVDALMPGYWTNAKTVVLGGQNHSGAIRILREYTENFSFADPALRLDLPNRVASNAVLGMASDLALWPVRRLPKSLTARVNAPGRGIASLLTRREVAESHVIVATFEELEAFGVDSLGGKSVVTSAISEERLGDLGDLDVDMVLDTTPQPFDFTINAAILEAMMLAASSSPLGRLTNDDLLDMVVSAGLEPRLLYPNGWRRRSRFAFVIHPLSQSYLTKVEPLRTIEKHSPSQVMDAVEKVMAYMPPFTYSKVTGVVSPTGAEAEGWLISVGGTPKELMAHSPEFTYARLLAAADQAKKMGAQVMGLGAFTKVVGDAGVTVAKQASLPITTGNSYSASGALWAAHDALERLGLADRDTSGRIAGKAMVVGATGAIGSVCARLLALASDDLYLISPETGKLLALKGDIEKENPRASIHIAATPGDFLPDMDVIVTATSGAGKKVLDIMAVKPGCVITDVARPLDLSAEDVGKRPDVLVIESGEIELPGDLDMKNIGLPHGVAYACLAETVVLALEGRFETYTVGRNIEWEKVKEIYSLGLKHGMRLSAIAGVNGVYTDEDIARVRDLALTRRAEMQAAAG
ncbi:MAG TPA: dehydrogenase [Dermatophilaceae bacterium]|nr:dehydrogenase [Dermatophilaceae bacterium]